MNVPGGPLTTPPAARDSSTTEGSIMGTAVKARPTTYNGILMRSRLEADYAAYLDRAGLKGKWEYEPECFASEAGQWLPDFRVRGLIGGPDAETFVELKPAGCLGDDYAGGDIDKYLTRMTIAWASKPDAELALVYWRYGGPAEMEILSLCPGDPWVARGGPLPLLWTGMGQYTRCEERRGSAKD